MKNIIKGLLLYLLFTSTINAQTINVQQQKEDFDTLCHRLEQVHADLYLYQSPETYQHKKDSISDLLNKDRSLSDFYLTIVPLVASIRDGHTMLMPPATKERMDFLNNGGLTLPLRLKSNNGRLLVDFPLTTTSIVENDEIVSINGIAVSILLDKFYALLGTEQTNAIKDATLTPYISTLLWYIYGWGDEYHFTVKRDSQIWEETLKGITQADVMTIMRARPNAQTPQFSYTLSADKQTATLQILNFFQLPQLKQFCDSVFTEINTKRIPFLIIDVRNNTGGSSAAIDLLLSYLSHKTYTIYPKSELKVSPYSKAYHQKMHPEIYDAIKDLSDGLLYTMHGEPIPNNHDQPNTYQGKVTVLANEKTYSGASTFTHLVKMSDAGKVIGETGCPAIYFGNYLTFNLPHSNLQYYVSFTKFYE